MAMARSAGGVLAALVGGLLSACSGDTGVSTDDDCDSYYEEVATARTWAALKDEMLGSEAWGDVASIRTQAQGDDVDAAGDQEVVRVVDLLGKRGRRLAQVDVWRTDAGAWRAGVWHQCID